MRRKGNSRWQESGSALWAFPNGKRAAGASDAQMEDLINSGHNNLHLYVMNDAHVARKVIETLI